MTTFSIILLSVIGFSCKTNHYLSDPIKTIPNIGLQTNLKSNGILIASDCNLQTDTAYFENCLKGLRLNIELKSEIKIIDEIFFLKCPNTTILNELKAKYNVDGLLLLTKLNVQEKSYDVASKELFLMPGYHDKEEHPSYYSTIRLTNLHVKITSHWEYHDFTTGKSYMFSIKNDKVLELGQYVADIDFFIEENSKLLDPLFYLNGSVTASNLLGLNY